MKNKENKEKFDKRKLITKIFVSVLIVLMLGSTFSTCIYYLVTSL